MALSHDGEAPTLVLDGGTGLQRLARQLDGRPFRGTILLGHLHWDHTHGLPFFSAGDNPEGHVRLAMPAQGDPVEILERFMSPPSFPITPRQLRGSWEFVALEEGRHDFEGFDVLAREIPHKGGRTFGYRITDPVGGATLAYLSDHCPGALGDGPDGFGEYHEAAIALAEGADLLVHDAQYVADEYPIKKNFGHSAVDYAVALGREAGVRTVALFHHDPPRTDDEIDAILAGLTDAGVEVIAASEGLSISL